MDRKGIENQVVGYLSRLKRKLEESDEVRDVFIDEQLLGIDNMRWYACFANYLAAGVVPPEATNHKLKKFFHNLLRSFPMISSIICGMTHIYLSWEQIKSGGNVL